MSDREREIPPLRRSFEPGRRNFEQVGLGGIPLELERLPDVQLGINLADYSEMQPGSVRPYEMMRVAVGIVAAQFGGVSIYCDEGFYLEQFRNESGANSVSWRTDLVGASPAIATVSGSATRLVQVLPFPRLVINTGAFAAVTTGYYSNTGSSISPRLWVPPTHVLTLQGLVAATAVDLMIVLSGVSAV